MIEAIIALVVMLLAALGWAKVERSGRIREEKMRKQNDRIIEIHNQVRDEDRQIDERMREAEGAGYDEMLDRITRPNDY